MQIVILAAGQGTRLGSVYENRPKSLVPIADDRPYLSYQFNSLENFDFSKIIVVGGYGIDLLKKYFNNNQEPKVTLLTNTDYQKGNLYTLLVAKPEIQESFFLFNADHYYSLKNYQKIFATQSNNITIFCDHDRELSDDDMKVSRDGKFLSQMDKRLEDFDCGYVGVTFVPQNKLDLYWRACRKCASQYGDHVSVEMVLNILAKEGERISISDISGSWWTEIDTPEDLQKAREIIMSNSPSPLFPIGG